MHEVARGLPLGGNPVSLYTLSDPEPAAVRDALTARGYSEADAAALVDLCGTRMRLLQKALSVATHTPPPPAAVLMGEVRERAYSNLSAALDKAMSCGQSTALAALLDAVEAAQATGQRPFPRLPALPPVFEGAVPSPILHLDIAGHLRFQSRSHRRAWADLRRVYSGSEGAAALQLA